jgi:hypothetical protein
MYASPMSGLVLNFTGPRMMRRERAAMSVCQLLHVVPLLVPSRVDVDSARAVGGLYFPYTNRASSTSLKAAR